MFTQFANNIQSTTNNQEIKMEKTTQFVQAVVSEGLRLSYGALAEAARLLGEDSSNIIKAQRGASLVKKLPVTLQPHICQSKGSYSSKVSWNTEVPKDLLQRPVIRENAVNTAITAWIDSLSDSE